MTFSRKIWICTNCKEEINIEEEDIILTTNNKKGKLQGYCWYCIKYGDI